MSNNYTILGFGKSAKSALDFLLEAEHKVRIYDSKQRGDFDPRTLAEYEASGVEFELGSASLPGVDVGCDAAIQFIVSPGIPPSSRIIKDLEKKGIDFKTDLDLFTEALPREEKYIAVTGTNGKTTTTALIAHTFDTQGIGNIGKPFLDFQELSSPYVCELSSFQIFYSELRRLPDIAVHLNLTDDHLDWHDSLDEYKQTKARLFVNSKEERFSILNFDDKTTKELGEKLLRTRRTEDKSQVLFFSTKTVLDKPAPTTAYIKDSRIYLALALEAGQDPDPELGGMVNSNADGDYFLEIPVIKLEELNLVGDHNHSNVLAALLASFSSGLHPEIIAEKLKTFEAVPHRLEFVTELSGHKIYNDSKATNPDSAIRAIESFTKPIAIIGGKNKNLELSAFLDLAAEKCEAIVAIGELKEAISTYLQKKSFSKLKLADSLKEALSFAMAFGEGNEAPILLSPASSSFDMFKSYEDRGDQFKDLVIQYN